MKKLKNILCLIATGIAWAAPCQAMLYTGLATKAASAPTAFVDGPNEYAYVKQNPWTKFDPEGLSAYSDVGNYSQSLSDDGHPTLALGVTVAQQAWNLFSLGTASKNGAVEDEVNTGKISVANGLGAMAGNGGVAAASLAAGGATGVALQGTLGIVGAGMAGGAAQATTQIAGQRAVADATGTPYQGTAGSDALQVGLSTGLGGLFAPVAAAQAEGVSAVNNPTPDANPLGASSRPPDATGGPTVTKDAAVTVYRGVNVNHPGYADALDGNAIPNGGPSSPASHVAGATDSNYTSWTTDESVAKSWADGTAFGPYKPGGAVLRQTVPSSSLITPTVNLDESEVLREGAVTGATPTVLP